MIAKMLGSVLILAGCGGFGMMICVAYKREEDMLRQLIHALDFIQCELQFRMTPLPELCSLAGSACSGRISEYFQMLAKELEQQTLPDVRSCAEAVAASTAKLPERVENALEVFSRSLGQFDAQGQIQELEKARNYCHSAMTAMDENRDMRLRSYQTLGICAGAALVILLV